MKWKGITIPRATNVIKVLILVQVIGCVAVHAQKQQETSEDEEILGYEVINLDKYKDNTLSYLTTGQEEYPRDGLNYEFINRDNRRRGYILEDKQYVDFDTVFTVSQRAELKKKLAAVKPLELDSTKLLNPHSLYYMEEEDRRAKPLPISKITFPVIQK